MIDKVIIVCIPSQKFSWSQKQVILLTNVVVVHTSLTY